MRFPFPGLRVRLNRILSRIGGSDATTQGEVVEEIRAFSRSLEAAICEHGFGPERLSAEARGVRGWVAFFSDRARFDAYGVAVERARRAFSGVEDGDRLWPRGVQVRFRPTRAMYKLIAREEGVVVDLPTPMICFDEALFRCLARHAFRVGRHREALYQAMIGEDYQAIRVQLEALGGRPEQEFGRTQDLASAFRRVNRKYFDDRMPRPRLVWSRVPTLRKLGHYDPITDTLMVSAVLDQPGVAEFMVDFLVYHELLHKQLGITWRNGRGYAHTSEFKRLERRFVRYAEAELALARLSRSSR